MTVIALTSENIQEVLWQSQFPVVIYVWADWDSCHEELLPIFGRVAGEFEGRATFVTLNLTEQPEVKKQLGYDGVNIISIFGIEAPHVDSGRIDILAGLFSENALGVVVRGKLSLVACTI